MFLLKKNKKDNWNLVYIVQITQNRIVNTEAHKCKLKLLNLVCKVIKKRMHLPHRMCTYAQIRLLCKVCFVFL